MTLMQMTKIQKIFSAVLFLAIALGFVYFALNRKSSNIETPKSSTSTPPIIIKGPDGLNIEQVPLDEGKVKAPSLDRPVVFLESLNLPDDAKVAIKEKIENLQEELKKDTSVGISWINLGLYQKMAGDYEGASISWKFVSEASNDFVSTGNLGNLYSYYFKKAVEGEGYYKEAIRRAPKQAYLYIQLAEVYRDVFENVNKAKDIIEEGLEALPGDASLLEFRSTL